MYKKTNGLGIRVSVFKSETTSEVGITEFVYRANTSGRSLTVLGNIFVSAERKGNQPRKHGNGVYRAQGIE